MTTAGIRLAKFPLIKLAKKLKDALAFTTRVNRGAGVSIN